MEYRESSRFQATFLQAGGEKFLDEMLVVFGECAETNNAWLMKV
jgi:hypothetical protein